ncbi:MAG TPA: lipoate--protein ligase [Syntrophomonadaceae bacterium]|nr:lipoate--protein ligase [Syntrophomonadaceae bacterium]
MYHLLNPSHDPYFNLALEEYLTTRTPEDSEWFMLWQNQPAVIVGRHQNTAEEVNQEIVREKNIAVVRRMSGGGAVYHDLGNLNFTFIVTLSGDHSFARFAQPVLAALEKLGIAAELSGRNDLTIAGRKFSGNAQFIGKRRMLHHGTLLFNTDLEIMQQVLNVNPEKMASKGVKSVSSRVANIADHLGQPLTIQDLQEALIQAVGEYWPLEPARELTSEEIAAVNQLADSKYRRWEWNYGRSPQYNLQHSQRYPWGQIDIRLEIKKGRITSCRIYGDFFTGQDIEGLEQALHGIKYSREEVGKLLDSLELHRFIPEMDSQRWLGLIMGDEN